MTGALRYLLVRSFCNGVISRLARLRQPKYLIGASLGIAYFYFYFYKFLFGHAFKAGPQFIPSALWPHIAAGILLVAVFLFSWILPASRAAIHFTEAEIAFLFPAPIRRRTLIIHKLLKSQLTLLFLAVLMTLLTGRFRLGPEAWFRMGGWWIILNTLNLHRIAASFALQRLRERGMADWRRRFAALLAIGAVAGGVWYTADTFPSIPPGSTAAPPDYAGYAMKIATTAPLGFILEPFRWVVEPYFARTPATFLLALGPALGVLFLHFLWVLRAEVSFEEASIAAAQKRAAFIAAHRSGEFRVRSAKARRPLWPLRPTGFPPFAFLWKSVIKYGGLRSFLLWGTLFTVLLGAATVVRTQATQNPAGNVIFIVIAISAICYFALLISLIMVGQQASAQLRQSIGSFDLVKTYPLPGWQVALGELIGAVTLGTLLQWAALGVAAFLASGVIPNTPTAISTLWVVAGSLAVLLPAFNLATSILPSGAALMFPGWFKPGEAAGPGLENTGIRLVLGIFQLLAMLAAILPVVFFGACAWLAAYKLGLDPMIRAVAAVGTGAFVLALEAALGIAWLGDLYDHFDLSQTS